jgi:hypothetical protein
VRATPNEIEERLLGRAVLELEGDCSPSELAQKELAWVEKYHPRLVTAKVRAENLNWIHALEDIGFRFAECQLTLRRHLKGLLPVDTSGLEHFWVTTRDQLDEILELAGHVFTTDRFTTDAKLGPELGGKRYQAYLEKSFASPDEEIGAIREMERNRIVWFGSSKHLTPSEDRALLGAVAPEYQGTGLGLIADHWANNLGYARGLRVVWTGISAINYAVMPIHLNHMGYRITQAHTVLRKIYD